MFLSTSQTRALSDVMRLAAEAADADLLREQLALPMLRLLNADTYVSMTWSQRTQQFERARAVNMSLENLRSWDLYYRYVDPLTRPLMERRRPTVATQILPQDQLARTEFFNDFLRRDRMHWGVNVYFYAGEECLGDFRIWRERERGNFDRHELEALRLVEPAVTAALARLRQGRQVAQLADAPDSATPQLEALLRHPGRLSRREAEVAWLAACGQPDKQIARELGVGFATVRFHLANAFRKLQVDNRTALAARVQAVVLGEARAPALA